MRHVLTFLVIIASATLALSAPLSGQTFEPSAFTVQSQPTAPAPALVLEQRIEEARQSYRANRRLGNGLVAVGAAAVVGALADWAARDQFGMRPGATGVMVGGMSLVAWGTDRWIVARDAREQVRTWEAQLRSVHR